MSEKIPVLKLMHCDYPSAIYVNTAQDAANELKISILGEDEEWRDFVGATFTIEVIEMDKDEFENLPEFEGF
jgi:hypothetical protein